jgi:alkylhydroperoxidase/carboxymuconolactone decarboxylase family protein YurZ
MQSALRIGITKEELMELITQLVWYNGMPEASMAVNVSQRVLSQ